MSNSQIVRKLVMWGGLLLATYFLLTTFVPFPKRSATTESTSESLKQGANKAESQPESKAECIHVAGFSTCPYFKNAVRVALSLHDRFPDMFVDPEIVGVTRDVWDVKKVELAKTIPGAENHRTSPFVWEGCKGKPIKFLGGNDDFVQAMKDRGLLNE
ncbi:hypothetical protein HDU76_002326 [Blyttiomyces sp. JEL0837]|nr:hypothetical protein HDU76_002326 [Blyttiomyces sp. JEL0837]